ncbi:hypothetical protein [Lewinella cohaerens]|uniref:hypothetical protein n=1 Tax=Lewinella cohaerens TaxID=70995 RepID=UPI00036AD97E|nr:hypothetical protein [Lewinella cohaerens]
MNESEKSLPITIELLNTHGQQISQFIDRHQILFFKKGKKGILEQFGSGVLLKIETSYVIASAAHVTDSISELVVPFNDKSFKGIQAKVLATAIPESGKRADDKIDIALLLLSPETALELVPFYSFLEMNRVEVEHSVRLGIINYSIIGTPSHRTKDDTRSRRVTTDPLVMFMAASEDKVYEKYGLTKEEHIVVDFPKKMNVSDSDKPQRTTTHPEGISGSGLWFIKLMKTGDNYELDVSLIGIMIEFRDKYYRVMIATKMDEIINMFACLPDEDKL